MLGMYKVLRLCLINDFFFNLFKILVIVFLVKLFKLFSFLWGKLGIFIFCWEYVFWFFVRKSKIFVIFVWVFVFCNLSCWFICCKCLVINWVNWIFVMGLLLMRWVKFWVGILLIKVGVRVIILVDWGILFKAVIFLNNFFLFKIFSVIFLLFKL